MAELTMPQYFLTTAIDYVNSRPHLGTAYEKVMADVIARYKRLRGVDTHFLMGNDEHSLNVYRKAVELGIDPKEYCDRMEQEFRAVWRRLEISFDDFIRTTEPRHHAGVTALVHRINAAGDIYEGHYEGWYCVSCEAFKQDKDLADGFCRIHPALRPDWIREKNHFFRLSRYREPLLRHFADQPGFLEPDVRQNEILRVLEGGLEDISISRAGQTWGIPLPFDPSGVVYVWFDALINYISAAGYGTDAERFERLWPADLHVVGKDITRFHAVIWPAMLLSAGVPLPRKVFGHGFVHFKGEKMSKSLGTVVDPLDAAERFGPDPLRLFLVREIPFGQDGDFSWERFEERYNADLANNLGNLVSRITAMADRYRSGALARSPAAETRLRQGVDEAVRAYVAAMDDLRLQDGAAAAYGLIDGTNQFITETEPWILARDPANADRLAEVLFTAAETLRIASILLLPVIPGSAGAILARLGGTPPPGGWRLDRDTAWGAAGDLRTVQGDPLWPRLEAKRT